MPTRAARACAFSSASATSPSITPSAMPSAARPGAHAAAADSTTAPAFTRASSDEDDGVAPSPRSSFPSLATRSSLPTTSAASPRRAPPAPAPPWPPPPPPRLSSQSAGWIIGRHPYPRPSLLPPPPRRSTMSGRLRRPYTRPSSTEGAVVEPHAVVGTRCRSMAFPSPRRHAVISLNGRGGCRSACAGWEAVRGAGPWPPRPRGGVQVRHEDTRLRRGCTARTPSHPPRTLSLLCVGQLRRLVLRVDGRRGGDEAAEGSDGGWSHRSTPALHAIERNGSSLPPSLSVWLPPRNQPARSPCPEHWRMT